MLRLMNAAVMPQPGEYALRRVTPDEFTAELVAAGGEFESYIGYPQTAEHIADLTGVAVAVSRAPAVLEHGDVMLICRLAYRVANPAAKGEPMPEDWEYFICLYRDTSS